MNELRTLNLLQEGINDPGIFKAVFTAGGPGSGKSTVAKKLGLYAMGLRPINSDTAFTNALKKAGMTLKLDNVDPEVIDVMRVKAKSLSAKQMELAVAGRLGLVIDSTARNVPKILAQKKALEAIGYDTAMLFVDTSLETALERNKQRDRSVPETVVKKSHSEISENKKKLERAFGKDMIVIQNEGTLKDLEKATTQKFASVMKWIRRIPNNKFVKQWIDNFKKRVESTMEIQEVNRQTQSTRMKDRASANMQSYEKKLFKKMMANPKKAKQELEIAIGVFKKQLAAALPIVKPIIQAQLDKFTQLSDMLGKGVTEAELDEKFNIKNMKIANLDKLKKDPEQSRKEIDKIIADLKKSLPKFAGSVVAQVMQGEINKWERVKAYALAEDMVDEGFSDQQLELLRKEYGKIKKVDPQGAAIKKLKKFIKNMNSDNLKALANAKPPVPWLSMLARFQLNEENFDLWSNSLMVYRLTEDAAATGTVQASVPTGPESIGVKPDGTFGKSPVFDCDNDTFSKCIKGKKKYDRWASYLGKDNPFYNKMQSWMSQSYKNKNFVLRNKMTGEMVFARRMNEAVKGPHDGTDDVIDDKDLKKLKKALNKSLKGDISALGYDRKGNILFDVEHPDGELNSYKYNPKSGKLQVESMNEAKYPTWRVNFKGGPAPIVVARNTAEAIKKAEKIAKKQKKNHALQLTGKGVEKIAEKGAIPVK